MKRFLAWVLLSGIFPAPVFALGLGKLDLQSGLNEPFEATIELLSPTREELDSLAVRLADIAAFERAHIDRPFVLSQLRFEIVEGEGGTQDHVRVYSREALREPYLNFLVEANWSQGRLFREYTVLLDPPLYDSGTFTAPAPAMRAAPSRGPEPEAVVLPPVESSEGAAQPVASSYSGGDYGPTETNDTLWSIASRTRPDANTTVQQMMLALVRANPDAFIANNVNGLKRGQILRMPSQEELNTVASDEAFNQVKAQYAAWQQANGVAAAAAPPQRAVSTESAAAANQPASPPPAAAPAPAEAQAELKLVTPSQKGSGADQGANQSASAGKGKADEDLALATEHVEALSQENIELKDRLTESQTIVEDLKRLIALKDDELAALQQKLAAAAAQVPAPAAAPEPVAAAPAPQPGPAKTEPEPAPAAAEPVAQEPVAQEPAPAPAETPAAEAEEPAPAKIKPAQVDTSQGLVAKVQELVTANLQIVGMVGGGLAVLFVLAFVISRLRRRAQEREEVALEFPDFSTSDAEPVVSEVDDEDIEVQRAEPDSGPKSVPRSRPESVPAAVKAAAPVEKAPIPVVEAPAAPLEDPMGPVNVFMAYEHFDQAEEFVRDAIGREPENLDFYVKLLEVLSAANERRKYEDAAKVLHDKVNGTGAYWETALFYWDAMSPGRALFAAPVAGEEEARAGAGGGMLDLTAGESQKAEDADAGLDFDLGDATAGSTPAPADPEPEEEGMLDITSGSDGGLDLEPSSPSSDREDVLDVTAAVGLDDIEPVSREEGGHEEEGVLDLSQGGGEDLLDVTSHADLESSDLKEDLLDVTTATGASADADDLLAAPAEPGNAAPEGSVEFDLNLDSGGSGAADNVIEFESSGSRGRPESLDLDFTSDGVSAKEEDGGLEMDLTSGDDASSELSIDGAADDGAIELDMGTDSGPLEIEMDDAGEAEKESADDGLSFDLSMDDPKEDEADIDMEGTVEVKKLGLSLDSGDDDDDDDDDEEDRTVFVPRTKDAQEQTAEDEIATKLDLAKAYVELGDKDSAKSILSEVMTAGNPQQKKQAQELMKQMS